MSTTAKILQYLSYLGAGIAAVWLNMPDVIKFLLFVMGLDVITGFLCALQNKTLSSKLAYNGISRKVATLIIVALVYIGGNALAAPFAPQLSLAVAGYYTYTEALSLLENASVLGVPIPDFLKNALAALNPDKIEGGPAPVVVPLEPGQLIQVTTAPVAKDKTASLDNSAAEMTEAQK